MKPRSPVLGYNHNVRYAARLWHVQTEDSGVQAPHIYTHLFCDGTILASKKLDYDPTSEVATVQRLMQSQHKLMLRELKSGVFDSKIEMHFGPIQREGAPREAAGDNEVIEMTAEHTGERSPVSSKGAPPQGAQLRAPDDDRPTVPDLEEMLPPPPVVQSTKSPEDDRPTVPNLGPLLPPPAAQPPVAAPVVRASEPRKRPTLNPARPAVSVPTRPGSSGTHPGPPPTIGGRAAAAAAAPVPRSAPPTIGSGRQGSSGSGTQHRAQGVVVARPTVIVGKEGSNRGGAADFWKTEQRAAPDPGFGSDLISEKSLDEVILAYLSEDAPKK